MTTISARLYQHATDPPKGSYDAYVCSTQTRCDGPGNCYRDTDIEEAASNPCAYGYWSYKFNDCDFPPGTLGFFNAPVSCTLPNDALCPVIHDTTYSRGSGWSVVPPGTIDLEYKSDVEKNYKNATIQPITCSYGIDAFQTFGDILQYRYGFISTERAVDPQDALDTLNMAIMPEFCLLPSSDCPFDPLRPGHQEATSTCSRFISLDPEGELCRSWSAEYPAYADAVKVRYCQMSENLSKPECQCVNKSLNPIYNTLKVGVNTSDSCFWGPCDNSSQFLIPSTEVSATKCPDVCGVIINNYNNRDTTIDFTDSEFYVDCTKGLATVPTGTSNVNNLIFTLTEPLEVPKAPNQLNWSYWFIIAVFVVLSISFMLVVILFRG